MRWRTEEERYAHQEKEVVAINFFYVYMISVMFFALIMVSIIFLLKQWGLK